MDVLSDPHLHWKRTLGAALTNEQEYGKSLKGILGYFVVKDRKKVGMFLIILEQTLTNARASAIEILLSLKFLKEATGKRLKEFAEELVNFKRLYSAVYQIAIKELPKNTYRNIFTDSEGASLRSKCIKISIECILSWRRYFDFNDGNAGILFKGLYCKLKKERAEFADILNLFAKESQNSIEDPINDKIDEKEDANYIEVDQVSVADISSETDDDMTNSIHPPALNKKFSSLNSRKSALAQLEADFIRLKQMKIEEGREWLQMNVINNESLLMDRLEVFLKRVKRLINEMKARAIVFKNINPNRDEKRVLQDIENEEETMKNVRISIQGQSLSALNSVVFEYLNIRMPPSSKNLHENSPISRISPKSDDVLGNFGRVGVSPHDEFKSQESAGHRGPSSFSPIKAANLKVLEDSKGIYSVNLTPRNKLDQINIIRPKTQDGASERVQKRARSEGSSLVQLTKSSEKQEQGSVEKTDASTPQNSKLQNFDRPRAATLLSKKPKINFEKEMANIAKDIESSQKKSKMLRASYVHINTPSILQSRLSGEPRLLSNSTTPRLTPAYNLHVDFTKEINRLVMTSSTPIKNLNSPPREKMGSLNPEPITGRALNMGAVNTEAVIPRAFVGTASNGGEILQLQTETSVQYDDDNDPVSIDPQKTNIKLTKEQGRPKSAVEDDGFHRPNNRIAIEPLSPKTSDNLSAKGSFQKVIASISDSKFFENDINQGEPNSIVSWSVDKISVSHDNSTNSGWISLHEFNPDFFADEPPVKEVWQSKKNFGDFQISTQGTQYSEISMQKSSSKRLAEQKKIEAKNHVSEQVATKMNTLSNRKTMRTKEKMDSSHGAPVTLALLKVKPHPIFNKLKDNLTTKKALNMFKWTGLYAKGVIFDNETLNVSSKMTRIEVLESNQRLVKVILLLGNKRGEFIHNLSVKIKKDPAFTIEQSPGSKKFKIEPGKQLRIEFVVGLTESSSISHFEVSCIGEQVHDQKDRTSNSFEITVCVPLTYFMFMESLTQLQEEDVLLPWKVKSELILQSSGQFKLNSDIVQKRTQLQSLFQNIVVFPDSSEKDHVVRESYLGVVETERLGEFVYIRFDWFPKSHEMMIQTASSSNIEEKGEFLIQTLLFLLSE